MIKRLLGYFAIVLVILTWSFYYESYEMLFLALFLIALPILDVLIVNYSVKKINIAPFIKKSVIRKGEYIPVEVKIENKGLLPVVLLELKFKCINNYQCVEKELEFTLPVLKFGKQDYSFSIKSDHCGDVEIELVSIKFTDYFELYYKNKNINARIKLYVLPQIGPIDSITISKKNIVDIDGEKYSEVKPGDDPSQVFDFREYHPGDRLHSIHWKLSARRGNYMVKEYSLPLNGNYSVIMDLTTGTDKNRYDIVDAISDTTFAIILRLQDEGINHSFIGCERYGNLCFKDIIEHDLSLEETMFELYKSKWNSNLNLLDILADMSFENNESQVYYITSYLNKKNIVKLNEIYNQSFINIILIGEKMELDDKLIGLAYSYDNKISYISISNHMDEIAELEL